MYKDELAGEETRRFIERASGHTGDADRLYWIGRALTAEDEVREIKTGLAQFLRLLTDGRSPRYL